MHIMLVMTDYAKNYASTIYQSQIVDNYSAKTTDIVRRHPIPAK